MLRRECVRNEIALQRSGSNTSLLMRTRDLIASSARSASREVTNSITPGITYQCKIIIIPEEGWFGQPKYSTHTKKILLRCVDFCFYFFHFICEAD